MDPPYINLSDYILFNIHFLFCDCYFSALHCGGCRATYPRLQLKLQLASRSRPGLISLTMMMMLPWPWASSPAPLLLWPSAPLGVSVFVVHSLPLPLAPFIYIHSLLFSCAFGSGFLGVWSLQLRVGIWPSQGPLLASLSGYDGQLWSLVAACS